MKDKVKFFKALGDQSRLKIVRCVLNCEICACKFTNITKKDQTTVSRHLKLLVEAGVLKSRKEGRKILYSIKDENVRNCLNKLGIQK
jgi:ArsR family transcriptional regulator